MKLPLFYALVTILSVTRAFGQEKIWTKQTKISEVIAFEKQINAEVEFLSRNVSLSKEFYPLADKYDVTNPIIVKRKPLIYLPIYAEYYYTPVDSLLRLVSYNWEKGRYDDLFDRPKIWKVEENKFKAYSKEYERIKKILIVKFGTPKSVDESAKTIRWVGSSFLRQSTLWETDDVFAELNMIFAKATQRIRFTLYWKK